MNRAVRVAMAIAIAGCAMAASAPDALAERKAPRGGALKLNYDKCRLAKWSAAHAKECAAYRAKRTPARLNLKSPTRGY